MFLLETVLIVGTSPSSSAGFEKITFMVVPFRRILPVFGFGVSFEIENEEKERNKGFSRSSSRGCENCGERKKSRNHKEKQPLFSHVKDVKTRGRSGEKCGKNKDEKRGKKSKLIHNFIHKKLTGKKQGFSQLSVNINSESPPSYPTQKLKNQDRLQ